jgi:hypothetical protein
MESINAKAISSKNTSDAEENSKEMNLIEKK